MLGYLLTMHSVLVERRTAVTLDGQRNPTVGGWATVPGAPVRGTLGTPSRSDLAKAAQTGTVVEAVLATLPTQVPPVRGDRVTVSLPGNPVWFVTRVTVNPYTLHVRCWLTGQEA